MRAVPPSLLPSPLPTLPFQMHKLFVYIAAVGLLTVCIDSRPDRGYQTAWRRPIFAYSTFQSFEFQTLKHDIFIGKAKLSRTGTCWCFCVFMASLEFSQSFMEWMHTRNIIELEPVMVVSGCTNWVFGNQKGFAPLMVTPIGLPSRGHLPFSK